MPPFSIIYVFRIFGGVSLFLGNSRTFTSIVFSRSYSYRINMFVVAHSGYVFDDYSDMNFSPMPNEVFIQVGFAQTAALRSFLIKGVRTWVVVRVVSLCSSVVFSSFSRRFAMRGVPQKAPGDVPGHPLGVWLPGGALAPFLRPFLQSVLHGCYFGCPGCRAGAPRAWNCG